MAAEDEKTLPNGENLNRAATGIFEPSENPNKQIPKTKESGRAERAVDSLERDLLAHGTQSAADGKVELDTTLGPNDRIVGPDVGGRPHRPDGSIKARE